MTPAQIRERVKASRLAQGLPETVADGRFLEGLAREVQVEEVAAAGP
jgi:hypothetical protein